MRKILLFSKAIAIGFILLFGSVWAFGQVFTEDFTTGSYTVTLGGEGSDGTADYFFTTDGTNIGPNYLGASGNFFAGQDIDDTGWTGSANPSQLTWTSIDVTGLSAITFACDFASVATDGIDDSDYLLFEYQVDAGSWIKLIAFENDGTQYNTFFLEDTDLDSDGDGDQLTSTFATFTKPLTVSGVNLNIRFTAAVNSGGEDFAIDNIVIDLASGTPDPEPTNHATGLSATTNSSSQITVDWTDAVAGDQAPSAYLVKASISPATVTAPSDGTAEVNGTLVKNIHYGVETAVFNGLDASTTYNFQIWPYTNTGSDIDYKTDGTIPADNATTSAAAAEPDIGDLVITEVSGDGVNGTSDDGFMEIYNRTATELSLANVSARYYNSNPGASTQTVALSGTIDAGGFIIVTQNGTNFQSEYGFAADFTGSTFYFNGGDDGVDIYHSTLGILDQFNDNGVGLSPWTWEDNSVWERTSSGSGSIQSNWTEYPDETGTPKELLAIYWTGATSSDYSVATNWLWNIISDLTYNVTIPAGLTNYPTISFSASCNNILIESGASFIGAENLTVAGTSIMQRSIPEYTLATNGWHLLSSPANTMAIATSDFVPGATDDFFAWGETTYTWLNYKIPANNITSFVNGQGYLVAYENTSTKGFVGAFNNADVTHANLSKTADKGDGWHLLGNPFQSALQWTNTDWVRTNISAGAKIMNSGGSYSDITVGLVDIIPANQGFFVQASVDASNSITIPRSQRVHSSTAFYKSEPANALSLKASDGDFYVESWIQIMDGATLGFDAQYDMNFLGGMQNAPYIYSAISETEKLSTNRIAPVEQLTEVPLAFKSFLNKEYTLSTTNANSFESDIDVFLKDKVANVSINLKETPEYSFTATAGELTDRFVIQLFKSSTNIPTIELSGVQIFSNGEQIYLQSEKNSTAALTVYNMLGQEVYFKNIVLGGLQTIDLNQKAGWYIVRLVGEQGVVKEKVFIK